MSRHTSPPGSGDGIVAGQINAPKVAGQPLPHVRFGSKADIHPQLLASCKRGDEVPIPKCDGTCR